MFVRNGSGFSFTFLMLSKKKRAIYTDENEKMKQVMHKFCLLSKGAQRIHFN